MEADDKEIWKDINGYIGRYQISNHGRIRRTKDNKILKFYMSSDDDYFCIKLTDKNKRKESYYVHKLVGEHFVENDNPEKYNIVDHIDNNKTNNKSINLRWTNQSGNMKNFSDNHKKYTGTPITQYDLDSKKIKKWNNVKEIIAKNSAYKYFYLMSRVVNGKSCYGYIWKYDEKEETKLEKDEQFKNIGIIDGSNLTGYEISNYGKIRNVKRNTYIIHTTKKGYEYTQLYDLVTKKPVYFQVHRLVAMLFVPGKAQEKNIVNHIDKNRSNNYYKNLEWTTIKGNTIHAIGRKVQQIDIKTGELINTFDTITEAYKSFGKPCNSHISLCCNGKACQTLGYKWKYVI